MELRIDQQICDLGSKSIEIPRFEALKLADVEALRDGRQLKLLIPYTPRNEQIMASASDPHTATPFNDSLHMAQLTANGSQLFEGVVRLLSQREDGYMVEIREGAGQWAHDAALGLLKELPISFSMRLTPTAICNSWLGDGAVKFLPIQRDEYPQQNSSTDLLPAERLLSVDDYHPFLHIATLLKGIFTQSGYRIKSRFLDSEMFRSLYMSGSYSSRDTTALANRMEFVARRQGDVTAVANYLGQIFADPKRAVNSVGNIVQTATPQSLDSDGVAIEGLRNNSGCFVVEGGKIGFRPTAQVSVAFELYLKYTTSHRILTRERLKGIDSIWFGAGADMQFGLANRYPDRRAQIVVDHSYMVVVFNHTEGSQYRLTYTINNTPGREWTLFNTRSAKVATPKAATVANPALQILVGGQWQPYPQDWALYDGHIEERGQTTVEIRLRTPSEVLAAGALKSFDLIQFSGGDQGATFTLHRQSSMRARFTSSPGYNAQLSFADVAQNRIHQAELLDALQHMFNLRFYTEHPTRTVWIEPHPDFYASDTVVDWRDRCDLSQPISMVEMATQVHRKRTWSYIEGDGAVKRFDALSGAPFGQWSFAGGSYGSLMGEKIARNPLFSPTINSKGHYANAPSALLMSVGDRDLLDDDGTNFSPRIVRFCGLKPLPEGERWGFPANAGTYPLAAFHLPADGSEPGFTLCFEDRDQIQGLHHHYDRQVASQATRQSITLTIRLAAHEYQSLFAPQSGAPDICSRFLLDTGRGDILAIIETIGQYDPDKESVECTFTRQIEN